MQGPQSVSDVLQLLEEALLVSPAEEVQGIEIEVLAIHENEEQGRDVLLRFANGTVFGVTICRVS